MTDERQQRIDDSIAKQLQRSMERNAQLVARIEQLEAALREIASVEGSPDKVVLLVSMEHMRKIARAALDQKGSA